MNITRENATEGVFLFCALTSAAIILAIFIFMVALGLPLFTTTDFFAVWTSPWSPHDASYGLYPMILGTIWIAFLATVIGLPLSLGTSFVIAGLGGSRVRNVMTAIVRFMTAIPTVVYGFVGIFLLVPLVRDGVGGPGMCVLTAGIVLAVLISPTMILFFTNSLQSVDSAYLEAAKALGASRIQRLLYIMLPKAWSGITAGTILALGRALGDTLIALMLAGNAVRAPQGFLDPARTLTAHIALVKAADFDSLEFRSIFASGIALYLFITVSAMAVKLMMRKKDVVI